MNSSSVIKYGELRTMVPPRFPSLPEPDKNGNFPAVEYARASLARDIIRDRRAAGLTQHELAKLAGTRQETISRIESGRYTASVKLVERIDRALQRRIARKVA